MALFIGIHERPAKIFARYQAKFRPNGKGLEQPQTILSAACLCADNQEEAAYLAAPNMYWKVMAFLHGIREHLRSPKETLDLYNQLSLSDQAYYQETLDSVITGSATECRVKLEQLAEHYHAQELMLVNITHDFTDRCNSYRKLMMVFKP